MKTKRLYKSLLVLLVTFVVLLSIVPGTAFAEGGSIPEEGSEVASTVEGSGEETEGQGENGEAPVVLPDASAVVTLLNPDGSEYAAVPVDREGVEPLCWTLPAYTVDESLYPGLVFEGWSDGANVYAAGHVLQNLTGSMSLTAVVGEPATAQSPVGAPPVKDPAETAAMLGYLSDLSPNLLLAAGTTATTGTTYTAMLTGSLSLPAGTTLEDVVFTFKVSTLNGTGDLFMLDNSDPSDFPGFTVEVLDGGRELQITVKHIQSSTGGGSVEFGRFQYYFPNKITPNGLQATMELVSISCDDTTLEKDGWQGESYADKVKHTLTAQAASLWGFNNASGSGVTTPTSFSRVEGITPATQTTWPIASSNKPTFILSASERDTLGTGFVSASGATFVVELSATGNVILPGSILNEFASGGTLLAAGGTLNTVFGEYFGLNTAALASAGWTATAVSQSGKLYITFTNASLTATSVSAQLSILKVETNTLPTSGTATGTYAAAYVQDAQSYITYPSIGDPSDVKTAQMDAAGTYTVSHTINFTAPKALEDQVKEYLNARRKSVDAWYYEPAGYPSGTQQYGDAARVSSGDVNSRSYVSKGEVTLNDSTNTVNMDRIWFSWNLKADSALAMLPITRMVLKETGASGTATDTGAAAGWDTDLMNPMAFEMPTTSAGTTLVITATIGGATVEVYNSATSAVNTNFEVVTSGTKQYLLYKNYATTAVITGFAYTYTAATSVSVGSNPRVMFRVDPNAPLHTNDVIMNYSYLEAKYTGMNGQETLSANPYTSVPYKDPTDATVDAVKSVKNLSRSAGYRPGDLLQYTVKITTDSFLPYLYSNGLLIMDIADSQGIKLDKDTMKTQIVIQYGNNSTASSNKLVLATSHGVTPTITNNGKTLTYTDVPSAYGGPKAATTPFVGIAHFYQFSGHYYKGDTITITYYATVADTAQDDVEYKNEVYALLNWGIPGGTNPWGFAWKKIGGTSFKVATDLVYGDVMLTVRPADENGDMVPGVTYSAYLPGEEFYLDILGGLVKSSEMIQNPTYLVQLPENMQFAGDPQNMVLKTITLNTSAGTREVSAGTALNKTFVLQWLAKGIFGFTETTREEATHMRIVFRTSLDVNDLIGFQVPVKISEEITGTKAASGYANGTVKVGMSSMMVDFTEMQSIVSNHLYENTGDWKPTTGTHERFANNDFSNALKYDKSATGYYVFDSRSVTIHQYSSWATIAKTKGEYPIKPTTTNMRQDGLYLNDTLDFTVTVKNTAMSNTNSTYNAPGSFHPGPIMDILPDKMSLVNGTAKVTVDGADIPFTLTQTTMAGGRVRLVVTLNDTNYQLAYGKSLVFTYTARLDSVEQLNGSYHITVSNEASLYLDADKVYTNGKAIPKQGDNANWWTAITVPNGYSRLQAKVDLVIKDKTLALGIEKTSPKSSYTITTSADVSWSVKVTNAASSDLQLNGYQVVDVLPKDFTYLGMTSGPEPTEYVNKDGNIVLVWSFPASSPLGIGEAQTLTYKARASANTQDGVMVSGYYTNTAYVIPTQGLAGATILNGIIVSNTDTVYTGQLTLKSGGYIVPPLSAVRAINTVLLTNFMGAIAENTADYNNNETASRTTATLLEVSRNETVNYGFELKNTGGWQFANISIYDALPYANDKYTMRSGVRGSNFEMLLKESVVFGVDVDGTPLTGFTVYYSATAVHGRTALMSDGVWTKAEDWDWKSGEPKSFRVSMPTGFVLANNQTLNVTWQLEVPGDVLVENAANPSYNSAGYYFNTSGNNDAYYSEPDRVGVYVANSGLNNLSVEVVKELKDNNLDHKVQRTFTFKLEKLNQSTGEYDAVQLDSSYDYTNIKSLYSAADPSTYGLFTMTAMNYVTSSGSIAKLPAGTYRVTELPYDLSSYTGPDTYTVTGSGATGYIGLQNGKTIRNATFKITNVFDYSPPGPGTTSSASTTSNGGGTSGDGGGNGGGGGGADSSRTTTSRRPTSTTSRTAGTTSRSGSVASGTPVSTSGDASTTSIPEEGPPLVGPGRHWALLNLICLILSSIGAIFLLVMLLGRSLRRNKDEDGSYDTPEAATAAQRNAKGRKTSVVWRILSIVAAIASIVTFILTEDMRQPWIWVDKWSPLMIAFVLVTLASLIGTWYAQRKRDDDDDGQDYYYPAT